MKFLAPLFVLAALTIPASAESMKECRAKAELAFSIGFWKDYDSDLNAISVDEFLWESATAAQRRIAAHDLSCSIKEGSWMTFTIVGDQSGSPLARWNGYKLISE